jgi:hypothetical protein
MFILGFVNGIICTAIFMNTLNKELKTISSDIHKQFFNAYPVMNGFAFFCYVFSNKSGYNKQIKNITKYIRYWLLIFPLILVEIGIWISLALIIRSS